LLKNAHLLRCPHPSSLRRTELYVSLLAISVALYLSVFEQPASKVLPSISLEDFVNHYLHGFPFHFPGSDRPDIEFPLNACVGLLADEDLIGLGNGLKP